MDRQLDPQRIWKLVLCLQLNIYLMAFNLLLPAYPLDGGRILVDLLMLCRVPVKPAAMFTVALAVAIAFLIIAWGFVHRAILTIAVSIPGEDRLVCMSLIKCIIW